MRGMYKLLIVAACCLPVQAFAIEKVSVSELLDRYAANQDKLSSFIAKTEYTISIKWSNEERSDFTRIVTEARVDGKRTHMFYHVWDNLPTSDAPTPIAEARTWIDLWDAHRSILYYYRISEEGSGQAEISRDEKVGKGNINVWYNGAPFLGILYSDYERIDSVLRQANTISVRNELEQVGSVACYVIDANTTSGTYTVWIDPQHGYQVAQVEIRVGPNDRFRNKPLKDNESQFLSVRNIRLKNIEGIWIPMEADIYGTSIRPGHGLSCTTDGHHKITQITINPDHEALGSFVPVVENGTEVYDRDSGAEYTWQEGMKFVVDERDGGIRYVPKEWSILVGVGKPLPKLEGIKLKLSDEQTKDMAILLCFFDMEQRPSRNCVIQLAQKAAELNEKGVTIAAIQTSKVTKKTLNEWKKKYNISFPVGAITADIEKTRFTWGVRSLSWLILSDNQHIVTVEGFGPKELNDKIKATEPKPKAPANKHPSALDLLDRYAANQDKLKSFIMIADINYEDLTENKTASHFNKREIIEFRYEDDDDGFRAYYCPKHVHSAVDESLVIADHTFLWDCERFIEHQKAPTLDKSVAFVSFSTKKIKDAIGISFAGPGSILGFLYGDVERFDSILRQADSISVRDELERVGSEDCYVIDAKTKHGTYKIWLDPERGYGIAKADIHKGPKDLWFGRPLDYFTHAPYMPNVISIRNVRFESIEGIWVPMEVDFRVDSREFKGSNRSSVLNVRNVHYKVTELLLNPDHDALGSFVPDIENGTKVYTALPGLFFTWHNGKKFVVDKWDGSIKYVSKDWSILVGVGKLLPLFEGIKPKLSDEQTKDRAILLCFFDMNQRSSRYCVRQLAQRAAALKEKGVTVATVQTSQVTEKTLNEWIKKYNIPFSAGAITEDIEKTRFVWGVRSLPWLILTDKQHVVTAEGFNPAELYEKLGKNSKH